MQTFLPYSDFRRTAAVLDVRRLGKQRVETLQILRALTFDDYGWRNHPAVTMWIGYTPALVTYGIAVTDQWRRAGFADTVGPQLLEFLCGEPLHSQRELGDLGLLPAWLGSRALHRSHQAALLRKDPEHYGPLFSSVDPELPYVWPEPQPLVVVHEPVSAWVVRAQAEELAAMRDGRFAGVHPAPGEGPEAPAGTGTRNTKRRRQITAFFDEIVSGDRIVVPHGEVLVVAEVAGNYEWRDAAPAGLSHTRPVRWVGEVYRSHLLRPVHLQDPRAVFALRGEPVLEH